MTGILCPPQMFGCQNFCICETDSAGVYREKSDLALNLDKDDFVLGGYVVDSAKYPLKPRPQRKGKARVVEEEEEEDVDEEEEEEVAGLEDDEPVINCYARRRTWISMLAVLTTCMWTQSSIRVITSSSPLL